MKSVIQEASSITKAIELGWIKAGKPKEFSVKILEEATKNFFGFTTKKAKVVVFFMQTYEQQGEHRPQNRQAQRNRRRPQGQHYQTRQNQENIMPEGQREQHDQEGVQQYRRPYRRRRYSNRNRQQTEQNNTSSNE